MSQIKSSNAYLVSEVGCNSLDRMDVTLKAGVLDFSGSLSNRSYIVPWALSKSLLGFSLSIFQLQDFRMTEQGLLFTSRDIYLSSFPGE